ncbi:hypothetical protein [Candidatus Thiodictyon syntrophicum]|uniref:hypothetical protein n=1 Tax=Candidatus Thiodictyon syntrophicum TaxID=1166950 RepID=UPI001F2B0E7C|nr:hypothetical protein [Candidatus Thiodictyon syntrophicum]
MNLYYRFCDSVIECDRPLPELIRLPSPAPEVPLLAVRFEAPHSLPCLGHAVNLEPWPDPAGGVLQGWVGDCILIRVLGLADFLVRPAAGAVECHPLSAANPSDVRHFLLNQVLPRLVGYRSPLVLHASAILTDLGAIALVGPSGIGKSTLAASFGTCGEAIVLADDAVRIADDGTGARLIGAYGAYRLRPDSVGALRLSGSLGPQLSRGKSILTAQRVPGTREARSPLAAVFILQSSAPGGAAITAFPMSGVASVLALISHAFFLDPGQKSLIRRQFEAVSLLVRTGCRVYLLNYPRQFGLLPQVRASIIETLRGLAARGTDQGRYRVDDGGSGPGVRRLPATVPVRGQGEENAGRRPAAH